MNMLVFHSCCSVAGLVHSFFGAALLSDCTWIFFFFFSFVISIHFAVENVLC